MSLMKQFIYADYIIFGIHDRFQIMDHIPCFVRTLNVIRGGVG